MEKLLLGRAPGCVNGGRKVRAECYNQVTNLSRSGKKPPIPEPKNAANPFEASASQWFARASPKGN